MHAQNARLMLPILWVNLFTATLAVGMYWRMSANPAALWRLAPAWITPENWLAFGALLHLIAVSLMIINVLACIRMHYQSRLPTKRYAAARGRAIA
jgi:hypothetical protein